MDPKLEAIHVLVRDARQQIEDLRKTGALPEGIYYKALVCLAYEYALGNYIDEVLLLVTQIPADYFSFVSTRQMEEDARFKICAEGVAQVLVNAGYLRVITPKKKDISNVN